MRTVRTATFTNCDGEQMTVTVGDKVGFKADVEQEGEVTMIQPKGDGGVILTLRNEDGFPGAYLRYETETTMHGDRVWALS